MDLAPIVRKFQRRLQQLLRRRGRSREDTEDLIQEAFLRLHLYYEHGGEVRAPEAFLVRTVLRLASNARRDSRRHLYVEDAVEELPLVDVGASPEDIVAAEECLDRMTRTLDGISERTRDVLFLHRLDGLSYAQIAQLYNCSVKSIERRIAHGMLALMKNDLDV